jgi:hypothetical protein
MSVPSSGSKSNINSNLGAIAGSVISNSHKDQGTRSAAGATGGQNAQCGTVAHVGTSPASGTQTNCMTPCCLTGNRGTTPPNQLCLPCWLRFLLS